MTVRNRSDAKSIFIQRAGGSRCDEGGGLLGRDHDRSGDSSANLTLWLCKGVCQFTVIVGTDALHEFSRGEHTRGFHHSPFPMHPLGLNRIEAGILAR
jgi:hypothetical protein